MTTVPCNGCRACCYQIVMLVDDDNPKRFATDNIDHPEFGAVRILKRRPDGGCVYLTDTGCSIHGAAPRVCRSFDCRGWWHMMRSKQRREVLRHPTTRAMALAGKERLHTL